MVVVDDPALGVIIGPNLTRGAGGVGGGLSDADFERAIRHGIAPDGRRLVFMPSSEYQYMSDEDLGAAVAYVRSVPPVDRSFGPLQIRMLGRAARLAEGGKSHARGDRSLHLRAVRPRAPDWGTPGRFATPRADAHHRHETHDARRDGGELDERAPGRPVRVRHSRIHAQGTICGASWSRPFSRKGIPRFIQSGSGAPSSLDAKNSCMRRSMSFWFAYFRGLCSSPL